MRSSGAIRGRKAHLPIRPIIRVGITIARDGIQIQSPMAIEEILSMLLGERIDALACIDES